MANIFDKDNAALMSFGKVMSRMAAQPLDISEIWYNKRDLETYAASDATAYAGQKVTYVDTENNKVYQYSIQTDGSLAEIGVAPTGDETSITVSAEGLVAMFGYAGAATGTVPMKDAETGKLVWKTLEEIGAGDGNDNTTYEVTALKNTNDEAYGITIQAYFNGQAQGDAVTIALDVYTKSEVDAAIKVLADKIGIEAAEGVDASGLYKLIADEVSRATAAEGALSERIGVKAEGETAATGVYAYVDGVIQTLIEGVNPDKIDSLNELIAWVEAHPDIVSGLEEDIKANADAIGVLNGDASTEGSVDKKVADAIAAQDFSAYATKEGVAETYATKEYIGIIPEDAEATNIVGYINEKAQEVLDAATGGSSESAASVKQQLDTYKATNDPKVAALLTEVWGSETYTGDSRIDALEAEQDSQDEAIAAAKEQADKGVADAKTANDAIATLTGAGGRIAVIEADVTNLKSTTESYGTTLGGHETRVAAIENAIKDGGSIDLRFDALEAADAAQATTNTSLQTQITENKNSLTTLTTVTIPDIQSTLDAKADASAVYTKKEIGTITEGKTLIDMINEAAAAVEYDDTQIKADISANADAIAAIYKVGEDGTATGELAKEIERAKAAEKANADAIALLLNNPTEAIDSVTELVNYVNEHGAVVTGMQTDIATHEAVLTGLISENEGGEVQTVSVVDYVAEQIAAIPEYELPAATLESLGGIKASESIAVAADGTATVAKVSTDLLVQGTNELILFGGNASVSTEA